MQENNQGWILEEIFTSGRNSKVAHDIISYIWANFERITGSPNTEMSTKEIVKLKTDIMGKMSAHFSYLKTQKATTAPQEEATQLDRNRKLQRDNRASRLKHVSE